jgi:hypothetical protein
MREGTGRLLNGSVWRMALGATIMFRRYLPGGAARGESEGQDIGKYKDVRDSGGLGVGLGRTAACMLPPPIHFMPDSLTYWVPLCLKRRCGRTLGWGHNDSSLRLWPAKGASHGP